MHHLCINPILSIRVTIAQVNVLLINFKQNITALSLLADKTGGTCRT